MVTNALYIFIFYDLYKFAMKHFNKIDKYENIFFS